MGNGTGVGSHTVRWLAWATAGLLTAGVASAGALSANGTHADMRIVTAAGDTTGALAPPPPATPTATETPSPSSTAPTSPATTTAPLTPAARPTSASTTAATTGTTAAPTTQPIRTTATTASFNPPGPPVTPPTTPTTTSAAPTTTTTITGRVTVTIVSQYAYDVSVRINGQPFEVAPGASVGPLDLAVASNGNDSVEVGVVSIPTCGEGDAGGYFSPGGRYRLTVVNGGTCGDAPTMPAPNIVSTPV